MKIVCTGSVAYDYLMTFPGHFREHILADKLESISLSFLVDSMVRQRGGVAANIAYGLALLGDRPLLYATAGEDFDEYRVWLEGKGVDTSGVRVIPGKFSASFFANTDLSHHQISSFYTGAMAHAGELSITSLTPVPDLVVVSPNDPDAMRKYVEECKAAEIPYMYDPSQQLVRLSREDIVAGVEGAHSLCVNEYEFELLKKHTGKDLADLLPGKCFLVITRGEHGSTIYADGQEFNVPTVPALELVDPTGVGDAFRGGFLTGYRLGLDWETCGRMGALAATYCLEQRGTQNHYYTPATFAARYREHFGDHPTLASWL